MECDIFQHIYMNTFYSANATELKKYRIQYWIQTFTMLLKILCVYVYKMKTKLQSTYKMQVHIKIENAHEDTD